MIVKLFGFLQKLFFFLVNCLVIRLLFLFLVNIIILDVVNFRTEFFNWNSQGIPVISSLFNRSKLLKLHAWPVLFSFVLYRFYRIRHLESLIIWRWGLFIFLIELRRLIFWGCLWKVELEIIPINKILFWLILLSLCVAFIFQVELIIVVNLKFFCFRESHFCVIKLYITRLSCFISLSSLVKLTEIIPIHPTLIVFLLAFVVKVQIKSTESTVLAFAVLFFWFLLLLCFSKEAIFRMVIFRSLSEKIAFWCLANFKSIKLILFLACFNFTFLLEPFKSRKLNSFVLRFTWYIIKIIKVKWFFTLLSLPIDNRFVWITKLWKTNRFFFFALLWSGERNSILGNWSWLAYLCYYFRKLRSIYWISRTWNVLKLIEIQSFILLFYHRRTLGFCLERVVHACIFP